MLYCGGKWVHHDHFAIALLLTDKRFQHNLFVESTVGKQTILNRRLLLIFSNLCRESH